MESHGHHFESDRMNVRLNVWHRVALVVAVVTVAAGSLIWISRYDPTINFLARDSRAAWIVFPRPVHSASHKIVNLDTLFRREFSITALPDKAELHLRAARRLTLRLNDASVPLPLMRNWKEEAVVNVAPLLRIGANRLEARVFNDNAPAAFWLNLSGGGSNLQTDENWESSIAGSAWRSVALASHRRLPGPGNPIAGGESLRQALGRNWTTELFLIGAALVFCVAGFRWRDALLKRDADFPVLLFLGIVTAFWLGLFINNVIHLPFSVGFDSEHHLKYIQYIREHWRLPWANEGYEMFQAPFFYILSAVALAACRLSTSDASGILLLRGLTTFFAMAQFVFVLLSIRLLFPQRSAPQLVGLLLAAFLPMQLYLAHYVTNETLAAALASAALYLALRLTHKPSVSPSQYLLFGLILGAALLTKATTWLIVPSLFLLLVAKMWKESSLTGISMRNLSMAVVVMLAVCGWYYLRIWTHFGTPFLGNWDVASGFSWWQDPGYHVAADYGRFGRSLVAPFYGSLNGFLDGIYSTFWGDGLAAGAAYLAFRTPWNDSLMVCGYLWAIPPSVMIGCGTAVALWRFVRNPSLEYFLLLSAAASVAFGIILMTLKVACFGQVKAFYGLSAIVPICIFGVIGWEVITHHRRSVQFALALLLIGFALNSFAAVWIHDSPEEHMFAARRLRASQQLDTALAEANKAVTLDGTSCQAHTLLSSILADTGSPERATAEATRAVELGPLEAGAHLQLGFALVGQGEIEMALAEARRALELGPEDPSAYELLLLCLSRSNRRDEMVPVLREALALSPFSALLHETLGLAAARQGDYQNALTHFGYATLIQPNWAEPRAKLQLVLSALPADPDAAKHLEELAALAGDSPALLSDVAWLRATSSEAGLRNGPAAVAMAERACSLTKRKDATSVATLAASYAEMERFAQAMETAQEALILARAGNDVPLLTRVENMVTQFRMNHPYRETPLSRP
jgi:Flp pilus assembly protein TadD